MELEGQWTLRGGGMEWVGGGGIVSGGMVNSLLDFCLTPPTPSVFWYN